MLVAEAAAAAAVAVAAAARKQPQAAVVLQSWQHDVEVMGAGSSSATMQ